jgi:hypothetical protein
MEKKFKNRRPLTLIGLTDQGRLAFGTYVKGMHLYFKDLVQMVD